MRIPPYWARAEVEGFYPSGKPVRFTCWRWSFVNQAEAQASAEEAAQRVLSQLERTGEFPDRYGYAHRPLREEVLSEHRNHIGDVNAIVTRNAYGCKVLNTSGVMFIDIDLDIPQPTASVGGFFRRLRGKAQAPKVSPKEQAETEVIERLGHFLGERPEWGMRVYRTAAGFRCLVTHDVFNPAADSTQEIFSALKTDPLYMCLCKVQKSFRARLTPKPWRCDHYANVLAYPLHSVGSAQSFQIWLQDYQQAAESYATCKLVSIIGTQQLHLDLAFLIELHDDVSKVDSDLPLA